MADASLDEFREISHCGGKYTVVVKTGEDGTRAYQLGVTSSSPHPAALFCVAATYDGKPVGVISLGGWAPDRANEGPQTSQYIPVFVASDREAKFGHECPRCTGYWRNTAVPHQWPLTCPYCGLRASTHQFLTRGQRRFVEKCCEQVAEAFEAKEDGEYVINMDAIAETIQKGAERPEFYYVEESQQSRFNCMLCGQFNDILGKYGYCSCCGYRNNLDLFAAEVDGLKKRLGAGLSPQECVKNLVSGLDSAGVDSVSQLVRHVPMTPSRKKKAKSIKFHDIQRMSESLNEVFDIRVTKGIGIDDLRFIKMMFQRRHVFEHKGGVADQMYLEQSGDTTARRGQAIRETRKNAERFANLLLVIATRFHEGFHAILPVEGTAIRVLKPEKVKPQQ